VSPIPFELRAALRRRSFRFAEPDKVITGDGIRLDEEKD
jgi:hypothetical protein